MFVVKEYVGDPTKFKLLNTTTHSKERTRRFFVAQMLGPYKISKIFVVKKGHVNGPEAHVITTSGVIYIFNINSGRLVTCLIARAAQIERYYRAVGQKAPQNMLALALIHEKQGLNNL